MRQTAKRWDNYFDDLIFLKHLDSIAYIDTDKMSQADFNDMVLNKVKNLEVYNTLIQNYWVGFPSEDTSDESEEEKPLPTSNTPLYDHDSEGSVRFLDQEWVKKMSKEIYFAVETKA